MTDLSALFRTPPAGPHRRYEALRAFFVDQHSTRDIAHRFGYSPGSVRNLCTQFRKNPDLAALFAAPRTTPTEADPSPTPEALERPSSARARYGAERAQRVCVLRRTRTLSAADIARTLSEEGRPTSATTVQRILRQAGFARLPRRSRTDQADALRPETAPRADATKLDLTPRRFPTAFGGLFLFLPTLVQLDLDRVLRECGIPHSTQIPAGHAVRTLLALKLWGIGRPPHIMADVLDEGLALFAGLNAVPKRATLTEYSGRVDPRICRSLMHRWHQTLTHLDIDLGSDGSFDLDFHTIPYHGDAALIEKHYVSKRSRRQKGILAFLVRDADAKILCYANAQVRKDTQNDEILRFVDFYQQQHQSLPRELVFDSRLTTHAHLAELDRRGIAFLTLRKRSQKMMAEIQAHPDPDWRRIRLTNVGRAYRTPRVLDQHVTITGYPHPIRQLAVRDLGHDKPTLLLTNQMTPSASQLVDRYARRMVIENAIAEAIELFHMDALSAAVPMKVDIDLQLTLMAVSLYRVFALRLGDAHHDSRAATLFRDFIKATADIILDTDRIIVRIGRRAHNPFLLNAGFTDIDIRIPWLQNRRLNFQFV